MAQLLRTHIVVLLLSYWFFTDVKAEM